MLRPRLHALALLLAGAFLACQSPATTNLLQSANPKKVTVTIGDLTVPIAMGAVLDSATRYLSQPPVPITATTSPRSVGGTHDFYSEGDYWWPDPASPDSPYVRRDGLTNPANFNDHRNAMRNLARWTAALVAAYELTGDERYAAHAVNHLQAFFLDEATRMNPNLLYAQAIKGRFTGRGIGIIDTIHLIEVCRAIERLTALGYLDDESERPYRDWFDAYATWLTTHPYGTDERDHGNNHSTWWAAQVAAFAKLAEREDLLALTRDRFRTLMAEQLDSTGGFPDELGRTKPYSYSLFNLEGYSALAEIASTPTEELWRYHGPNGGLREAWDFMLPYIQDKSTWPYLPDVQHYDEVPIAQAGLLFAAEAYADTSYLGTWSRLPDARLSEEVDRTYPLRQIVLWLSSATR